MFGFSLDKKSMGLFFVIIIALYIFSGRLDLVTTLLTLPGIIIAISCHEFAHAYTAYKLGDVTPKYQGRLSLRPDKHIDLFGFMLLLVAKIGWGRPVEINPRNFKDPSKGEMLVSLAGPITNFIIAFLTLIIMGVLEITGVYNSLGIIAHGIITSILSSCFFINISLGVFNLIPLPPLDGSKI